jgi:predicted transcriptional regulator
MKNKKTKTEIEREILSVLKTHAATKSPYWEPLRSKALLDKINEQRKREKARKMSPTTFNLYMQRLVKKGLVKKTVERHKNVRYEFNEIKGMQWAFNEMVLSISDFLLLVPVDVDHELVPQDLADDTLGVVNNLFRDMKEADLVSVRNVAAYIVESIDLYRKAKGEKVK